jgi:[acyl-carrier-protein] S-malonyltransferase
MRPAAESMQEKILGTDFNNATTKIVNNVTAKAEDDAAEVKKLLIEQIFSTVRWRESLIYMNNNSIKNFIEIGPGKVLTGMVKRTIKDSNCFSINTIADIKNLENELK